MPDTACPPRPWVGFNTVRWVGHDIQYNSGGTGIDATSRTYTSTIIVPQYCILIDVMLIGVTLWTGSSTISAIVGDADTTNGFFTTTNLKATDLLAGESISVGAGTAMAGGLVGGYVANSQWGPASATYGQWSGAAGRKITCTVTAAGTATAGRTLFVVGYLEFSGSEPMGVPTYASA